MSYSFPQAARAQSLARGVCPRSSGRGQTAQSPALKARPGRRGPPPRSGTGLRGRGLRGAAVSRGNLPPGSGGISPVQLRGLQLLPYVGCRCLRDPSRTNVIIRAGIYADDCAAPGLRRGRSSSPRCWFRDATPFDFGGQVGGAREGETRVAETER